MLGREAGTGVKARPDLAGRIQSTTLVDFGFHRPHPFLQPPGSFEIKARAPLHRRILEELRISARMPRMLSARRCSNHEKSEYASACWRQIGDSPMQFRQAGRVLVDDAQRSSRKDKALVQKTRRLYYLPHLGSDNIPKRL